MRVPRQPGHPKPERRAWPRHAASDLPHLSARLISGQQVRLINLSRRGVLVETARRLLPNSAITLRFLASDASVMLRGCIVRSSVEILEGDGLMYRVAIAFEDDVPLAEDRPLDGMPGPAPEPVTLVAPTSRSAAELSSLLGGPGARGSTP